MTRSASDRARLRWWRLGLATAILCGLLGLVVAVGALDHADSVAREWFRPDDVWGPAQLRADRVVEGLEPRNVLPLLLVVGLVAGWVRRSWEPPVTAAVMAAATTVAVFALKWLVQRPDTHDQLSAVGGSYPSGHTAALLVALGGAALVVRCPVPWWQWCLVGAVGLLMAGCLLVQAAHWMSDVVGGALLGTAVLAFGAVARSAHLRRVQDRRAHPVDQV